LFVPAVLFCYRYQHAKAFRKLGFSPHFAFGVQGRTQGGLRRLDPPLNGNRLSWNLLVAFVKTQKNSAHAYIATYRFRL